MADGEWLDEEDVKLEGLEDAKRADIEAETPAIDAAGGGTAAAVDPAGAQRHNPLVKRLPGGAGAGAGGRLDEVLATIEGLKSMGLGPGASMDEVAALMKQVAAATKGAGAAGPTPAEKVLKSIDQLRGLGMSGDAPITDAVNMLRCIAGSGAGNGVAQQAQQPPPTGVPGYATTSTANATAAAATRSVEPVPPPGAASPSAGVRAAQHQQAVKQLGFQMPAAYDADTTAAAAATTPQYPYRPQTPTRLVENEYNRRLEDAIHEHFKLWVGAVRDRARRAIDWVLNSMLEEANKGRVNLAYDIPPGQEDFLHETFPEWMTEEKGIDLLRNVVLEEIAARGMKVPADSLEKRTHGENRDRYYFRLSYTIPAPQEVPTHAHATGSPMYSMTSSIANGR